MNYTQEMVVAAATEIFGPTAVSEVLVTLDSYGTESYEREVERVRLAILHLSEGQLDKLRYWLRVAKTDYRDALLASHGPLAPAEGERLEAEAKSLIEKLEKK